MQKTESVVHYATAPWLGTHQAGKDNLHCLILENIYEKNLTLSV